MNIKLIKPDERIAKNDSSAMTFKIKQLNLPLLAAYTPSRYNVKIIDESFEKDNYEDDVDLVGITVMTQLARRAYKIADTYRERGVKVVMGGIHASALPDEALEHADSVVIGEGEGVWPQVLADAEKGDLKKRYQAEKKIMLDGRPMPRYDLYPKTSLRSYTPFAYGVETSRGCPYDCDFCSVGLIMGHEYRVRPVDDVIKEIEKNEDPNVFFVDDNLSLNRKKGKELFSRMIPLKRRWVGEGGVSLAEDTELLRLMRRSGCQALLVGFESVQKQTQQSMLKIKNLKIDYKEAMKRFHGEGISILGAFVFGFDHEDKDIFLRRILVGIQFFIAVVLIAWTLVVLKQIRYTEMRDPGFDREGLVVLINSEAFELKNAAILRDQVLNRTNAVNSSYVSSFPYGQNRNIGTYKTEETREEKGKIVQTQDVDARFIPVMGLEITAGRNFEEGRIADQKSVLINQKAVEELGLDNPVGQMLFRDDDAFRVIGVVKDWNTNSIHSRILPVVLHTADETSRNLVYHRNFVFLLMVIFTQFHQISTL